MDIAIIGTGNVGGTLAASSVRAGHQVIVSSASPEHAKAAAQATGARAAGSNRAAAETADVVVLAVPYPAVEAVLDELGEVVDGKILIDVTNPLRQDATGLATEGSSAAELIQARVPAARVVKAFNTAFAARQADPVVDGTRLDGFVAGDDQQAKAAVLDLVGSIGFRPIDAGPLAMARSLEAMALLNITLQLRNGWPWQSGWKLVGPTAA
jgi:hypothetical protein